MSRHRPLERAALAAAVAATVPYLVLKVMWLSGSTAGMRHAAEDEMHSTRFLIGNTVTIVLMLAGVGLIVGLTRPRAERVPAGLVLVLGAGATGLLAPILLGLPLGLGITGRRGRRCEAIGGSGTGAVGVRRRLQRICGARARDGHTLGRARGAPMGASHCATTRATVGGGCAGRRPRARAVRSCHGLLGIVRSRGCGTPGHGQPGSTHSAGGHRIAQRRWVRGPVLVSVVTTVATSHLVGSLDRLLCRCAARTRPVAPRPRRQDRTPVAAIALVSTPAACMYGLHFVRQRPTPPASVGSVRSAAGRGAAERDAS